jgi:hypothetical protein
VVDGDTVEFSMFRDVRSVFDILRAASSILADKIIRFGTTIVLDCLKVISLSNITITSDTTLLSRCL